MIEGAGSAAEVNLRANDIANMGFARAADVPVVLLGDIDRGGVIAQIVGTRAVIDEADVAMIKGFLVNRFRGDASLFEDGMRLMVLFGWTVSVSAHQIQVISLLIKFHVGGSELLGNFSR